MAQNKSSKIQNNNRIDLHKTEISPRFKLVFLGGMGLLFILFLTAVLLSVFASQTVATAKVIDFCFRILPCGIMTMLSLVGGRTL